ncbi:hypothetical protein L195_g063021, partial [Trifolium pratense]
NIGERLKLGGEENNGALLVDDEVEVSVQLVIHFVDRLEGCSS